MLDRIFLQILNMTFISSIAILMVLLARLLLKKAPKILSYALWSVVLFRLICPFTLESIYSLLPKGDALAYDVMYSQKPKVHTGISSVDGMVNSILPAPINQAVSVNPIQILIWLGSWIWIFGAAFLLLWGVFSYFKLKRKLKGANRVQDNVYIVEGLDTPFLLGIMKPRIYLPSGLDEGQIKIILLHEQTHIRRFDPVIKLFSYLALCIHWFNPFVWIAYLTAEKDMEMSCDERVIQKLGNQAKQHYSESLLAFATGRKTLKGISPAFGEGETKTRIQNILTYQKPAVWGMIAGGCAVLLLCTGLACNPYRSKLSLEWAKSLPIEDILKIELITMTGWGQERYRLVDQSEYPELIQLLHQSHGAYVEKPQEIAGGGMTFYITTMDGIRHTVTNNGNLYLEIDGDTYRPDSSWMNHWPQYDADEPIPEDFYYLPQPITSDQAMERIQQIFPEPWGIEADGDQMIGNQIYARFRILSPLEEEHSVMMVIGVRKQDGKMRILESDPSSEEFWLYTLLSNVSLEDGVIKVVTPSDPIPMDLTLYVHISGKVPIGDGSYITIHALEEETDWKPGEQVLEKLLDGEIPDGTEIMIDAGFMDQQGNVKVEESVIWEYQKGRIHQIYSINKA